MPDQYNLDKNKFIHLSRHVELVVVGDRDVMAFYVDTIPEDATSGIQVYRDGLQTSLLYGSSPLVTKQKFERVLLWGRLSGAEVVSAFHWVPYMDSDNADTAKLLPLREVFAPRVIYDRTANAFHLWFWTNVSYSYNDSTYDESKLYYIGTQGYQTAIDFTGTDFTQSSKRVLCYAVGQLGHYYRKGASLDGFVGFQASTQGYDLVPIFTKPKIINFDTTSTTGVQGPGIIADGWYLSSGGGGGGTLSYTGPWACEKHPSISTRVNIGAYRSATQPDFALLPPSVASYTAVSNIDPTITGYIYANINREGTLGVASYGNALALPASTATTIVVPLAYAVVTAGVVTSVTQLQYGHITLEETVECSCAAGGPQGARGWQGFQGFQGLQGPQGFQGFLGMQGMVGFQGTQGPQGTQGTQGTQGIEGVQGNDGFQGVQGTKSAIVKVGDSYRELDCIESPEVLFFDRMTVRADGAVSAFVVDPWFVEVCEPGSIRVVSATSSVPVVYGARMKDLSHFEIELSTLTKVVEFRVLLCGVRKGFAGRRFAERTEEDYRRNDRFWKSITSSCR